MSSRIDFDLAVIGAGIVGMSSALWAQMRGLHVALCDPAAPGSGTTSGSACTIATYACVPVNAPSVIASLPRLMTQRDSPLSLDLGHCLRNPRWTIAFLRNCAPARVRRIAGHLAELLSAADDGLDPLVEEAGARDLISSNDTLYVWSTERGFRQARGSNALRGANGVAFETLSANEIRQVEPGLQLPIHAGLRFHGARQVADPQELVRRFHDRFTKLGGVTIDRVVAGCQEDDSGVTLRFADQSSLRAAKVAVAAGAFSHRIPGARAERLPLRTERGYHVSYRDAASRLSRPVGWAEGGFYAVPTLHGLRFAGTVEITALDAPFNTERIAYLARQAHRMLGDDLGAPDSQWLGYRPTMPDALPVIGLAPGSERIIHAFGHQHIGLTLGGVTGRIVTDLASGRKPSVPIDAFDPARFG